MLTDGFQVIGDFTFKLRRNRQFLSRLLILFALSFGALLVHGYHPNAEDAEIYLPGVEKKIDPELFPYNQQFFLSHARLTVFPQVIAGSLKLTHLSLYPGLLAWHFVSIFLFLFAGYELAAALSENPFGRWAAVGLLAGLLTLPVAGTALYIMDQYLNPRNLSAFTGVLALALLLKRNYVLMAIVLLLGLAIHPFMGFFSSVFCGMVFGFRQMASRDLSASGISLALLMPFGFLYPAPTPAYHQVALTHPYHYLLRWQWYEWLGAIGPIVIFWWLQRMAQTQGRLNLQSVCRAAALFGVGCLVAALILAIPKRFEVLARIQPLRGFYLLYILLLICAGIVLGEFVLKHYVWRWGVLFLPICAGMFLAQRSLFPESAHVEWPWAHSSNPWVQAFEWTRTHTPRDAMFALDPYHMRIPGEDTNGFRAIAQRSMLADAVKDSGAVSMFPPLAEEWVRQVDAQKGWKEFGPDDYRRLSEEYNVSWVVVEQPAARHLDCPYQNPTVAVCRLDVPDVSHEALN